MYSRTLRRTSSGVPLAVIICTTSSGTSFIASRICSSVAGHVSTCPISSSSSWLTPLAFMMCGCWPRYWVTSLRAPSSAFLRSLSTEHTTSCGRSIESMVRPAFFAPCSSCSIAPRL